MTLNALVCATIALVHIAILCHTVGAPMRHVVIVANPLLLLIPTTVAMQALWKTVLALSVALAPAIWSWILLLGLCWL